jgi:chromosome segregation ATPase
MLRISSLVVGFLLACSVLMPAAGADEKGASREREALRRTQQQLQQLRADKSAQDQKLVTVEQENAALADAKNKLASQIQGAQSRAKAEGEKNRKLQLEFDALTQEKAALQTNKLDLEKRLAELTTKQVDTERELAKVQTQRKQVEFNLATRSQELGSCENKNIKLYQHGRDLISQCQDQSVGSAVLRLEPFTGIKRVAIENMLEEYRDKLDAQKNAVQ